jgi:ribosomal protein L33
MPFNHYKNSEKKIPKLIVNKYNKVYTLQIQNGTDNI